MYTKKYASVFIVVLVGCITYLQYSTISPVRTLHNIYRELYYIPVFIGALTYGLAGALLSYLLIFCLYLPYVIMTWPGSLLNETNRLLPLLLQGLFAAMAGYLVDRDRKHRTQLERDRYLADVGRIATVIVHDLKNPLIAIEGFARRIKEGRGNTDTAAQVILNSSSKMQKIVTSVLDFSRPLQLDLKQADLRNIVKNAEESCRIKSEQREVILSADLPSVPICTGVDSFHLERALVNLIANAIEASGKEQRVSILLSAGNTMATIVITDKGLGMDKKILENIFVPFYTKKRDGTGLGMPIAKKIIEGHQGEIHIRSKPGRGTEVVIELPLDLKRQGT
ncbi:MAG TPA: HAMP domain-containing sensor histidine kinase [Nitrospirota bacterium]|nr:HAMP domain-containing sensor histidine kinase [Nitrospirota bacterium]